MKTFEVVISILSLLATTGIFVSLYKLGKRIGMLEERLNNLAILFDEKLNNLSKSFDEKLNNLSKSFDEKLNNLSKSFDEKLNNLSKSFDVKLNNLRELFDEKLDNLRQSFEQENRITNGTISALPCREHNDRLNEIHDELLFVKTFLTTKFSDFAYSWSIKNSPAMLNENGLKLYQAVDGDLFLNNNEALFLVMMEARHPKTALDAEIVSNQVLAQCLNLDLFNALKNWVYNSPVMSIVLDGVFQDYTISIYDVCFVISLPLRDRYLALHPELSATDEKCKQTVNL